MATSQHGNRQQSSLKKISVIILERINTCEWGNRWKSRCSYPQTSWQTQSTCHIHCLLSTCRKSVELQSKVCSLPNSPMHCPTAQCPPPIPVHNNESSREWIKTDPVSLGQCPQEHFNDFSAWTCFWWVEMNSVEWKRLKNWWKSDEMCTVTDDNESGSVSGALIGNGLEYFWKCSYNGLNSLKIINW